MATIREVGSLDHSHPPYVRSRRCPEATLPGKCTMHHNILFPINRPKQENGFMPRGGPNLGKTACVIPVMLPCVGLLFVQCDSKSATIPRWFW